MSGFISGGVGVPHDDLSILSPRTLFRALPENGVIMPSHVCSGGDEKNSMMEAVRSQTHFYY